ncbi:hypothetical protein XELAEV_18029042mg [Xenopus laevis]|uniref:Uncharacterized protein n=1 Tax=Xenopus laevis TaxID=8355 RepID=A0A974HHB5_XENLA|nr:hypothetical protein XELAEV_18029042mg [Xenopus laevis]
MYLYRKECKNLELKYCLMSLEVYSQPNWGYK